MLLGIGCDPARRLHLGAISEANSIPRGVLTNGHTPSLGRPKTGKYTMKKNLLRTFCGLTFLSVLLFAPQLLAQGAVEKTEEVTTTTKTTTTTGTVSQFGPDAIVIRTTTSSTPVSYSSTKTTTYVDENGNPVSIETVKSGAPVTIHYTKDGDEMVATKVVVKKTSTTTTEPRG